MNVIQCWVCSNNGVRRYGESCNLNNNCKFPKCLNQIQVSSEEQLKKDLEDFKNAYVERNDKCNELQTQIESQTPSPTGDRDCEELKKVVGSIERNANKISEHTWKVYKEQILEHCQQLLNKHP